MTDYQLTQFLIKAQEDARRCYRIYLRYVRDWEKAKADKFDERGARYDVVIWQNRARYAADHAQEMMAIVTSKGNAHSYV